MSPPAYQIRIRTEPPIAASYARRAHRLHWVRSALLVILWLALAVWTLWAIGALWFDFPQTGLRKIATSAYALCVVALLFLGKGRWQKVRLIAAGNLFVLVGWLTLQPSNNRIWQPDVAQTAWAEVQGDRVTIHSVRNCEYRSESDYTPRWETRTIDLSRIKGLDLAINYWGSAWMAHPIASFEFEDGPPLCFSIETRKEVGESYSAIGGLYRQYELIYVCAEERDVLRVRTNFRRSEDVYLYHTSITPAAARERFLDYIAALNRLHARPRWYNAITTNCTTSIRTQRNVSQRAPWDWRILFNGYADEMLYERGMITGALPFPELKRRARINDAAQAADAAPNFSELIRAGRPGFETRAAF